MQLQINRTNREDLSKHKGLAGFKGITDLKLENCFMAIIIIDKLKGNDALEKYHCNTCDKPTIQKKSAIEKEWQITKSS